MYGETRFYSSFTNSIHETIQVNEHVLAIVAPDCYTALYKQSSQKIGSGGNEE